MDNLTGSVAENILVGNKGKKGYNEEAMIMAEVSRRVGHGEMDGVNGDSGGSNANGSGSGAVAGNSVNGRGGKRRGRIADRDAVTGRFSGRKAEERT